MGIAKSRITSLPKSAPPLVRLQLALPFIQELERLGVSTATVLQQQGLARSSLEDANLFISVNVIHRLLEDCSAAASDPYLGARVGEKLDYSQWSPLVDAAAQAQTLGDFLTRFILAASKDASSATHTLELKGVYTFFRERRVSEPEITPSQNDAFTAAYVLSILQGAVGEHWDQKAVLLQVCSPMALPKGYHGIQVVGGDNRGMSIRFPTVWLTHTINRRDLIKPQVLPADRTHPPGSFLEALWLTLGPRLGSDNLTVDHVAHLLGISHQTLQRRLKADETSLTQEIAQLKQQHAIESLVHTDQPIAEVGEALGFQSPASFARAFKSWTGCSPRDYRNQHRQTS
jgi:AraC-like DNA-binding protein